MSPSDDLRPLFEAKALAELASADAALPGSGAVAWAGDPEARVFVLKGAPDAEDLDARRAFAGPDGEAARKALAALGHDAASVFMTVTRPAPHAPAHAVRRRLVFQIEAVDPAIVLATDPEGARDIAEALGVTSLPPGRPVRSRGRILIALSGLRASLADEGLKRRVWRELKALAVD